MAVVRRGEIWWVDFGDPIGSAPAYRRPAAIVSSDRFNRSKVATVIVAAVTSNLRLADSPGNVALAPGDGGLPMPSVINITQLLSIGRDLLLGQAGRLAPAHLRALDQGLRLVLDL
ncbi:MAG TPA: type II toxin-antitoxin system PemK/MazF family toxin [Actinomycetota bacterium]|nr:type II toxin-antitoxin system PemK/MazF family toxin [Actinomycetota bacterium]